MVGCLLVITVAAVLTTPHRTVFLLAFNASSAMALPWNLWHHSPPRVPRYCYKICPDASTCMYISLTSSAKRITTFGLSCATLTADTATRTPTSSSIEKVGKDRNHAAIVTEQTRTHALEITHYCCYSAVSERTLNFNRQVCVPHLQFFKSQIQSLTNFGQGPLEAGLVMRQRRVGVITPAARGAAYQHE